MRISDWSSDVCSSDLSSVSFLPAKGVLNIIDKGSTSASARKLLSATKPESLAAILAPEIVVDTISLRYSAELSSISRSEEHTSELQSLMRISYAVFCLKKKKQYTSY